MRISIIISRFKDLIIMIIFTIGIIGCTSTSEAPVGRQSAQMLEKEVTKTIRTQYLLYLPENYTEQ